MSAIKYQLREVLSSLSAEANKIRDPEIKKRLYLLKAVSESKKDIKKTCESRGVSTDAFYEWSKRLLITKSLVALKSLSKAPKKFWNKTPERIEKRVVKIRKAEPFKGPETISFDLKRDYNMKCPPSTVAAILERRGLIKKEYRDRLTKKHMKRYRRPWPGHLQMDFKYTPFLIEEKQYYQLSCVDHHSSWRFIRACENRTIETVLGFLDALENEAPFPIVQIQTDNALEFTDKYHNSVSRGIKPTEAHEVDQWCKRRGIEHKLIPIGEKEINGKVENTHRFDDRELFSQNLHIQSFDELDMATLTYNERWNNQRATKTLGWQTPNEVINQSYVRAYVFLKVILPESAWIKPEQVPSLELIKFNGSATIEGSTAEITRIKTIQKPYKKRSVVSRYLDYMDWEAKRKIKSLAPVPMIFQNFTPVSP